MGSLSGVLCVLIRLFVAKVLAEPEAAALLPIPNFDECDNRKV